MDRKFNSVHIVENVFIRKLNNAVESLNQNIQSIVSIPSIQRRLIRIGKQQDFQKMLVDATSIRNKTSLVSPNHLLAWQIIDETLFVLSRYCLGQSVPSATTQINNFIRKLFSVGRSESTCCLMLIRLSFLPELLVSLHISTCPKDKAFAAVIIMHILKLSRIDLMLDWRNECACLVLELCKLLRTVPRANSLYLSCRSTLGFLLQYMDISSWLMYGKNTSGIHMVTEVFAIVSELENKLGKDLVASTESPCSSGPFFGDVCDFKAFLLPLHTVMKRDPILRADSKGVSKFLYTTFRKLLRKMDECLLQMQDCLPINRKIGSGITWRGWFHHLDILKELHKISVFYEVAQEEFWMTLRLRDYSLCELVVKYCNPKDDVTSCEFRRQLARQIIPKANEDFQTVLKLVIGRFFRRAASSTYVEGCKVLPYDLFLPFSTQKDGSTTLECSNEPDLLFLSICQAVFNPQNGLFMACPDHPTRLFPNHTTKLENLHLECYSLAGSLIALALIHKVRVGVVFDRLFFLQLAGKNISLEDVRDADPSLYRSCKKVLDMDDEYIDFDALKMKFIEDEDYGTYQEYCCSAKSTILHVKDRKGYVNLVIQNHFVTSISKQVAHFAQGLSDVLGSIYKNKLFFNYLDLKDFDRMLNGSESSVSSHEPAKEASYRYYSDRRRHVIRDWEKGRLLGCGSYGSVYEGYGDGGFFFAVKEVRLPSQGNQAKQCIYQIEQEIALLSEFNHPNIVRYYGTDKDESKLYIFLELVSNGSVAEVYSRYHLKDSQVSAYTRQILQGLKYLHKNQIVHRDIKCANILVNVGGSVKLADFGLAKVIQFDNMINSCKGTPAWMAPEVVNLKRRGGYGLAADVWSLGCTVLEMLTRKRPYFHLEPAQVLYRIGKGELPLVPYSLSVLSQDFILKCLQVNPEDRPTAAQLLNHPFVRK